VEERDDGLTISGGRVVGGDVESHGDHRLAMAFATAGLAARGDVNVHGAEAVAVSYPGFWDDLEKLSE
jgi:3-phosphoshikimate 1-carboxyvinyltransferase